MLTGHIACLLTSTESAQGRLARSHGVAQTRGNLAGRTTRGGGAAAVQNVLNRPPHRPTGWLSSVRRERGTWGGWRSHDRPSAVELAGVCGDHDHGVWREGLQGCRGGAGGRGSSDVCGRTTGCPLKQGSAESRGPKAQATGLLLWKWRAWTATVIMTCGVGACWDVCRRGGLRCAHSTGGALDWEFATL